MSRVHVRVPATTANIGPGFDCLGCALSMYADFTCEIIESGLEITGCPEAFRNEDNLFVQAFRLAEKKMGVEPVAIRLHIDTEVPVSRGLGSSATLLAGGAAAANALHGNLLTDQQLVEICNDIEGHPDNIAPAVLGGMCVSFVENGVPNTVPVQVAENVGFIALIPNFETETKAMRAVLPKQIPFADAVYNSSRLAVLLYAFGQGNLELIGEALDDRLHQPYRKPLIHEYFRAEEAALKAGCAAFCISGSGSTCLAVVDAAKEQAVAAEIQESLQDSEYKWKVVALHMDADGAHVVEN